MGSIRLPELFSIVQQYEKKKDFVFWSHGNPTWYGQSLTLTTETFFERKQLTLRGNHHTPLPYHRISCKQVMPVGFRSGYGYYGGQNVNVIDFPGSCPRLPSIPFVADIYSQNVVNPRFVWNDNMYSRVTTSARASLAGENMNLGATFAEAGETASYIADKAGTVFGMLRAIKKGNLSSFRKHFKHLKNGNKIKARHISKTAAERWLEWKYAVVPLCSDIQSGITLFREGLEQNRAHDRPWEIVGKSRAGHSFEQTVRPSGTEEFVKTEATYFCKIYATVSDADAYAASQLGLNVPSAAWELVPFSFVLDWAVPVGTFLQALYATNGLSFSRGYVTIKWNTTWTCKYTYTAKPFRGIPPAYGGVLGMVRMPLSVFPVPKVFYKSPFSTSNIITSLALFRVLFMK